MATPSSVNAPGDASFSAADRLAIINLFGAYAQSYDAGKTDEFLSVFTEEVELIYSGRLYFQVFSITDGGAPSVAVTGYYEFTAVKKGNTWKFSRWIARVDQGLG